MAAVKRRVSEPGRSCLLDQPPNDLCDPHSEIDQKLFRDKPEFGIRIFRIAPLGQISVTRVLGAVGVNFEIDVEVEGAWKWKEKARDWSVGLELAHFVFFRGLSINCPSPAPSGELPSTLLPPDDGFARHLQHFLWLADNGQREQCVQMLPPPSHLSVLGIRKPPSHNHPSPNLPRLSRATVPSQRLFNRFQSATRVVQQYELSNYLV